MNMKSQCQWDNLHICHNWIPDSYKTQYIHSSCPTLQFPRSDFHFILCRCLFHLGKNSHNVKKYKQYPIVFLFYTFFLNLLLIFSTMHAVRIVAPSMNTVGKDKLIQKFPIHGICNKNCKHLMQPSLHRDFPVFNSKHRVLIVG